MILGILAVMKAGAAYVAIDPDYPAVHVHYILEDSKTQVLLTETKHTDTIAFTGPILDLIAESNGHRNPKRILRALESYHVALINFVPSMFKVFLNSIHEESIEVLNKLKYVLVAGEAISHDVVEQFSSLTRNVTLDNLYGPTEATVIATSFPLRNAGEYHPLPIGKPIQNVQVYVMNESIQLEPIGIVGELYIAGAGVARGYLNKPELNEQTFFANPFVANERMYRTGDLARWLPDGNIEFLGRMDHQVRIRGYRIELEEIETRLRSYEGIADVVVLDKDDSLGNKQLVAYIITTNSINMSEIKEHLSKQLPSYMIPAHFMTLDTLPITTSGKVNRRAL